MRRISVPFQRVDENLLRSELRAAGVPLLPDRGGVPTPFLARSETGLYLYLPEDVDIIQVRAVLLAHVPPAEKSTKMRMREAAAAVFDLEDTDALIVRALVLSLSDVVNDLTRRIVERTELRKWTGEELRELIRSKLNEILPD